LAEVIGEICIPFPDLVRVAEDAGEPGVAADLLSAQVLLRRAISMITSQTNGC